MKPRCSYSSLEPVLTAWCAETVQTLPCMAPKKRGASEYIKETEAWCAEYGTKYGFPQESADHAGHNLARKLRLNEERFSVADKSALDKMREQRPQPQTAINCPNIARRSTSTIRIMTFQQSSTKSAHERQNQTTSDATMQHRHNHVLPKFSTSEHRIEKNATPN